MMTEIAQAEYEYRYQRFLREAEADRLAKLARAGNGAGARRSGLAALFGRLAPRQGRSIRSRSEAAADRPGRSACAA